MWVEQSNFEYLVSRLHATSTDTFYISEGKRQMPVDAQLWIALFRFGNYGKGTSAVQGAHSFGVSPGSVILVHKRVLSAVLRWNAEEMYWPSRSRRVQLGLVSAVRYGLRVCVGAVDGTT